MPKAPMAPVPERRMRRGIVAGIVLATLLGGAAGCSSGGGSTGSPSGTPTSVAGSTTSSPDASSTEKLRVARVAVLSSEHGALAAEGKGVRNSVALAVLRANATHAVPGWRFELAAKDDGGNQAAGQQAASGIVETAGVIGVIGSTSSTIDEGVQPILNSRGIPMISPGGTSAQLTRRLDGATVVRPFPSYFRLSPTEADQGTAAARYVAKRLKAKRVAVLSDGGSYGRLLASSFAAEAKRLGLRRPVVRVLDVPDALSQSQADVRRTAAASQVRRADVDAVFFGGSTTQAAGFARALSAVRVRVPLVGGDSLLAPEFLTDVPVATARGDLAVFPGAAADQLATAQDFLVSYRAAGFGDDPGLRGANAFDAAQALIQAFGRAVGSEPAVTTAVRSAIVAELGATRFVGATGPVSFDAFGDAEHPPLSMYRAADQVWEPAGVIRVG